MIEIPESLTIAEQLNETVFGKKICRVITNASPHKFAFYHGDPADYNALLTGQVIGDSFGVAKEKPQPLADTFDRVYFDTLRTEGSDRISVKAFLATEQRIPGLGNGVLQEMLFHSGIHPKHKMGTIREIEFDRLFHSVKDTLAEMTRLGGRDTEKNLFGSAGGYRTLFNKNTVGKPCPVCGTDIQKTSYLGGAVYWCPRCQPL